MNLPARHHAAAAALLCAGALLGAGGAALVRGGTPESRPTLTYDCDSPSARVAEIGRVLPGPSYRIGGRVRAGELRGDERWRPVAMVKVESADESRQIMLEITAREGEGGPLELALRSVDGLKTERRLLGEAGIGEALAFDLTVADGRARARIGAYSGEVPAPIDAGATVAVGCTTGAFRFEALDLDARAAR
jgi:hypothetical protein